jgi:AcrR family transcriptional regulator
LTAATHTEEGPSATRRILSAARTLIARGGAAELSIGDVAAEAGVSKALIHYHFRDKDTLLVALVEDVGSVVLERAKTARESAAQATSHALDAYWDWFQAELRSGDVAILMSLAQCDSDRVRDASRRVASLRRELTAAHTSELFERLGLRPSLPPELIAETVTAFGDGLAAAHALEPDRDPRPAFDVLWLALLTLAE